MIQIINKQDCCGCGACAQVCPKDCIDMVADAEGFLYPVVDKDFCINCGKCNRICPVLDYRAMEDCGTIPQAYAAYCKDTDVRLKSSSGGLFTIFANKILEDSGVVYGAAYDADMQVHHIGVDNLKDLDALCGSKYVQSRTEDTFRDVKQKLRDGRTVLYTGTACQIAGLKALLGKDYENLYTIDVLCHGVPSPKVWELYLEMQKKSHGAAVRRTLFRHKKYGWKAYALLLEFTNNKAYERIFSQDPFMQMFLKNICLRPSCYACEFKGMDRPSDITIGDCWGIENVMPDMDDDKGTSVLLIHTEKGKQLLENITCDLVIRAGELECLLPSDADSRKSVLPHEKRTEFFEALKNEESFARLSKFTADPFSVRLIQKIKRGVKKIIRIFRK